ncbi:hypothetical protein PBN151_3860 [Paenibacillus sp. NAIST15-1]|nr:hypothetical protein PBN151_3860 [Paenibacillus sp. NAIST15-1]
MKDMWVSAQHHIYTVLEQQLHEPSLPCRRRCSIFLSEMQTGNDQICLLSQRLNISKHPARIQAIDLPRFWDRD